MDLVIDTILGNMASLIIGAILGAIAPLIITPLLQDKITDLLVWLGGGDLLRRKQNLTGNYHQEWSVYSKEGNKEYPLLGKSDATIRHFWTRITGKFTFDGQEFRIRGKINNNFINGEWFDVTDGSTYHGVFQFRIETHTRRLVGRWLGFSKLGTIRSGDWIWEPSQPVPELQEQQSNNLLVEDVREEIDASISASEHNTETC
jgi:hypothetical protein